MGASIGRSTAAALCIMAVFFGALAAGFFGTAFLLAGAFLLTAFFSFSFTSSTFSKRNAFHASSLSGMCVEGFFLAPTS